MSLHFLDFEASSLDRTSYPIEVGWCDETGQGESYLIRPEPSWTAWDPAAEAVHGLSREHLEREGAPAVEVAMRLIAALSGADRIVVASSDWDAAWCTTLLGVVGQPSAVRVQSVEGAYAVALAPLDGLAWKANGHQGRERIERLALEILERVEDRERAMHPVAHRALADAQALWRTWAEIRSEVLEWVSGSRT